MILQTNAKDVAKRLQMAKAGIMRANVKSVRGATLAGQRFARKIAPVDEGELRMGIVRKPVLRKGKQVSSSLVSSVKKNFPYQKWVNEDIKTVRLFGRGKARTYRNTKHTGTPGYFRLTAAYMSKIFPTLTVVELRNELKAIYRN